MTIRQTKQRHSKQKFFLCARVLAAWLLPQISQQAHGSSIEWGSENGRPAITSNGSPMNTDFHFELGTFGGFNPTSASPGQWRGHWKLLDSTSYNPITGIFIDSATFSYDMGSSTWTPSLADVPSGAAQFAAGEQIYLWIYNKLTIDVTTEWAVFSRNGSTDPQNPDWLMPIGPDNQTVFPQFIFTPDISQALYGSTPTVSGAGMFTPPTKVFGFQTHAVVPETGTCLLVGLTGAFLLGYRKR